MQAFVYTPENKILIKIVWSSHTPNSPIALFCNKHGTFIGKSSLPMNYLRLYRCYYQSVVSRSKPRHNIFSLYSPASLYNICGTKISILFVFPKVS